MYMRLINLPAWGVLGTWVDIDVLQGCWNLVTARVDQVR